jgi:rhamnose utilization protein RhaD (predicted bifunctional aldolase and dehydrogenase)
MQSAWTDRDADAAVARYANLGRDLALRVYTTRLLGGNRRLVLHGGGNTFPNSWHMRHRGSR